MGNVSKMTLWLRSQLALRQMPPDLPPEQISAWIRAQAKRRRFTVLSSGRIVEPGADESRMAENGAE